MNEKIAQLRKILDDSTYTVALCGSGMMEEGGFIGIKKQDKAYDIENRYGYKLRKCIPVHFTNTRPEQFSSSTKGDASQRARGHCFRPGPGCHGEGRKAPMHHRQQHLKTRTRAAAVMS